MTGRKGVRSRVDSRSARASCLGCDEEWLARDTGGVHSPTIGEIVADHVLSTGHEVMMTRTRTSVVYRVDYEK